MRILYDGEIYEWQAAGGINRYFASVIGGLPRDFRPSLLASRAREVNFPSHPNLTVCEYGRRYPRLEGLSYRLGLYTSRLRDRLVTERLMRGRFDVFHPTYYTLLTKRPAGSGRAPTVLTVWDMIHELFPAEMDPTGEHADRKRRAILAAERIICISENTKKDLLERYPVPEGKVAVTYLASGIDISMSGGPEPVPARPYFLYVGSRSRYKNFDGLLRAFARAAAARGNLALCVVGPPFTADEEGQLAALRLAGRVEHYGQPADPHLAKLYRHSLALVYPSRYEGFGIPPLEAMSCGTVAVVSDASSLPEVVGDAGVMFDPRADEELTDILLALAADEALRRGLIEKGRRRAEGFGWGKTVAQTVEVYRSAAG
jgi:glycosyltransferase involved in cell wall biosynthesis